MKGMKKSRKRQAIVLSHLEITGAIYIAVRGRKYRKRTEIVFLLTIYSYHHRWLHLTGGKKIKKRQFFALIY